MLAVLCFTTYVGGYIAVQEFLLMRLYKVTRNRKKCAAIVFVSSLAFLVAEYYLGIWATERMDGISTLIYNTCHMIYTFATLTIIGVYAEGFLPRNFIKIFLYYDVLTTLMYGIFIRRISSALFESDRLVRSIFQIESLYQYPVLLEYVVQIISVLIIASIINDYVDIFIKKIPDKICVAILLMAFLTYIMKIIISVKGFQDISRIEMMYSRESIESLISYMVFMIILIGAIGFMILTLASNQKKYGKLISLEMTMQQDYYKTVAKINRTVRELKHDLANHATVISNTDENTPNYDGASGYKEQLFGICDNIEKDIGKQLEWRCIESNVLSDREKYEIYRYFLYVCERHKIDPDNLMISSGQNNATDQDNIFTEIKAEIPGGRLRRVIIRNDNQYRLLSLIIKMNGGIIKLERNNKSILLSVRV